MTQGVTYQSYLADFLVNQSQVPVRNSGVKMNDGCGGTITESSRKHTPIGSLLKIVTDCSLYQNGTGSSQTWKEQVINSSLSVFRLKAWAHRMSEKERLLLPTPRTSQDWKPVRNLAPSEKKGTHGLCLSSALSTLVLPTPCASEWKRAVAWDNSKSERQKQTLAWQVRILAENLPTPTCGEMVIQSPSPSEYPGGCRRGRGLGAEIGSRANSLIGKRIHPNFVEWMMGFPLEWTNLDCKLSGMQLCHESYIRSLERLDSLKQENNNA